MLSEILHMKRESFTAAPRGPRRDHGQGYRFDVVPLRVKMQHGLAFIAREEVIGSNQRASCVDTGVRRDDESRHPQKDTRAVRGGARRMLAGDGVTPLIESALGRMRGGGSHGRARGRMSVTLAAGVAARGGTRRLHHARLGGTHVAQEWPSCSSRYLQGWPEGLRLRAVGGRDGSRAAH